MKLANRIIQQFSIRKIVKIEGEKHRKRPAIKIQVNHCQKYQKYLKFRRFFNKIAKILKISNFKFNFIAIILIYRLIDEFLPKHEI